MARFEVTDDLLLSLIENRDSANTKHIVKGSVRILEAYCDAKSVSLSYFEDASTVELTERLTSFYAVVRTQKREVYSKKSMLSIRYGLQKHFSKTREIDIVNDLSFKPANKVFDAMLVKIKNEGKGVSVNKQPLSDEDIQKLYNWFDLDTPVGLQNKVFVDFMIYFCNRGRENLRDVKKSDILFCGSGDNKHIKLKDRATKNHSGDMKDTGESQGGVMYPIIDNSKCPITSMVKYLSKLNTDLEEFWQRPHLMVKETDSAWYMNSPLGKNTLGNKMKELSLAVPLSKVYTNHCLRATSVTIMDKNCYEARHIMAISGHKSETSIRSYARADEQQKRQMAQTISSTIAPEADHEKGLNMMTEPLNLRQPQSINNNFAGISDENVDLLTLSDSQEHALMRDLGLLGEPCTQPTTAMQHSAPLSQTALSCTQVNHQSGKHIVRKFSEIQNLHIHYH